MSPQQSAPQQSQVSDPATGPGLDLVLAIISHEIRTPLTAAAAGLHLLAGDRISPEERRETGELVARQLRMLSRLADDVLDGASVALGKLPLHLESVDLRSIARSIAADSFSQVTVEEGEPTMVRADPRRMTQVLNNVFGNATRHGVGAVSVDVTMDGAVGFATVGVTNHVRAAIGIDEAVGWFEPFARGGSRSGHGLGLYVVRALMVAHAGTVGVDSLSCDDCEIGQDLRMWLRLPIDGPADAATVEIPAPRQPTEEKS